MSDINDIKSVLSGINIESVKDDHLKGQTHPITLIMPMAVWMNLTEMQKKGGPDQSDYNQAQKTAEELGPHGDQLLYGGGEKGRAAVLFNQTAHAIAVLSYVPGGITIFGHHYETQVEGVVENE